MMKEDLILGGQTPLQPDGRMEGLSTDAKPGLAADGSPLGIGTEWKDMDTGASWYWDGGAWQRTLFVQKFDQLVEVLIEIRDLLRDLTTDE